MLQDAISKMDPTVSNGAPRLPARPHSPGKRCVLLPRPALLPTSLGEASLVGFTEEQGRSCHRGAVHEAARLTSTLVYTCQAPAA